MLSVLSCSVHREMMHAYSIYVNYIIKACNEWNISMYFMYLLFRITNQYLLTKEEWTTRIIALYAQQKFQIRYIRVCTYANFIH